MNLSAIANQITRSNKIAETVQELDKACQKAEKEHLEHDMKKIKRELDKLKEIMDSYPRSVSVSVTHQLDLVNSVDLDLKKTDTEECRISFSFHTFGVTCGELFLEDDWFARMSPQDKYNLLLAWADLSGRLEKSLHRSFVDDNYQKHEEMSRRIKISQLICEFSELPDEAMAKHMEMCNKMQCEVNELESIACQTQKNIDAPAAENTQLGVTAHEYTREYFAN